jgi:hypothetical protein
LLVALKAESLREHETVGCHVRLILQALHSLEQLYLNSHVAREHATLSVFVDTAIKLYREFILLRQAISCHL